MSTDAKLLQIRIKQQLILRKIRDLKTLQNQIQFSFQQINHQISHIIDQQIKIKISNLFIQFPSLFQKFVDMNNQFNEYFQHIRSIQQICLLNEQTIYQLNKEVEKQSDINKTMKREVLELNYLISQHVQMSKKKMIQKDQIISYLKQKLDSSKDTNSILNNCMNKTQTTVFEQFNSKNMLQKSNRFLSQKPNLDVIHEEQQPNFSNRDSTSCNIQKHQRQLNQSNIQSQDDQNIENSLKNSNAFGQKSDPKTKTKNFIEDFRKGIVQNCNITNKMKDIDGQYGQINKLSNSRNDINKIHQSKNQSPKTQNFSDQKIIGYEKLLDKQNLNSSMIKHRNKIFSKDNVIQKSNSVEKTPNKQRPNSKQKIHLVIKQNNQMLDNKLQLKHKIFQIDPKILKSRPNSKQKLAVTCKNIQNNHKLKFVVGNKTINNRKNVSLATQKMIKQILESLDLQYGDKSQQLLYLGNRISGVRIGKGRLQYTNGLIYQGQFKQNARNGFGTLQKDKIIYQGQWERDKLCGKGTLKNIHLINKKKNSKINLMNFVYIGQFEQNRFHGIGTILISSIQKFYCTFHDGLPQGQYTFYNKQGFVEFGVWDDNRT